MRTLIKNYLGALAAMLVLSTCATERVAAQVWPQSGWTPGMFDSRALGWSFAPQQSLMFGGAIQRTPYGSSLTVGRRDGAAFFSAPWRQPPAETFQPTVGDVLATPAPILQLGPSPSGGGLAYSVRQPTGIGDVGTLPAIEMGQPAGLAPLQQGITPVQQWLAPAEQRVGPVQQGVAPAEQGADPTEEEVAPAEDGLEAGPAITPIISGVTLPHFRLRAAFALPAGPQPFTRSPELSDRLTRIARDKGMLSGKGIDVYLSNRVARLQGAVRTARDRDLLANVVGLEPGVQQVDNRLVVGGSAALSSNQNGRQ